MNNSEVNYRWVVFASVILAFFVIVLQRTAPGLITEKLMDEYAVSAGVIGFMSSLQYFAYSGLQIPVGLLSDRFGPNRFLILGTLLAGLGCILYNFSPNEYILIFSRFIVGVGDSMIFINIVSILNRWFKPQVFIRLMGLVSLFTGTASLLSTVPFAAWIDLAGWRVPFLTIGLVLVALSLLLYNVLIARPKKLFTSIPREKNNNIERKGVWTTLSGMVSNRQAWATFLCHFGLVGTYIGFIGSWAVPYGMNVFDMTNTEASQIIMVGFMGAIIGGPLVGFIASKSGSIKRIYSTIHLAVFLSWICLFILGTEPTVWAVVFLFFVIGFGNGASTLTFAVVRNSVPVNEVGGLSGFANTGGFLSAVILPVVFGKFLDFFPKESLEIGYHYGLLIPILFTMMGLVGALLIKEDIMQVVETKPQKAVSQNT